MLHGYKLKYYFLNKFNKRLYRTHHVKPRSPFKTFLIHLFHALSLFALGMVITVLLTEVGKRWVGRLRPYFISVCKPNYSAFNCTSNGLTGTVYNPIYTGGSFCTGDAKAVKEARYSVSFLPILIIIKKNNTNNFNILKFPSGHSSFSWYTMLFTIVYLQARLILLRVRYLRVLLQMACFLTAFVTMLSRVSDYHHRMSDVLGGMILGKHFYSNLFLISLYNESHFQVLWLLFSYLWCQVEYCSNIIE